MLLATFLVTTTADSGSSPLSLRQAIIDSNATPGLNIIDFSIGAVGSQQTIAPTSALPSITNPVFIDGWSQGGTGYNGVPLIVFSGSSAGTGSDGLDLDTGSDGTTIRALVINDFGGRGISIATSDNLVESSYVGTDATGSTAMGVGHNGIYDDGTSNSFIGNVIDSSGNIGLSILGNSTLVQGNLIGLNAAGTAALGNAGGGISIGASDNTIGGTTAATRNVISGNTGSSTGTGVTLEAGTADNLIEGNYIGTNAAGTAAVANVVYGIDVNGSSGNSIGGATATPGTGAGNVISGNANNGVILEGAAVNNILLGNIIGLNVTGTAAVDNGSSTIGDGVLISSGSSNTIGGTAAVDRNIISGNYLRGFEIDNGTGNVLAGNYIGTDITGTVGLGNGLVPGYAGLYITAAGNTIGGTVTGAGNVISDNGTYGIRIQNSTASGNLVAGNEIGTNAAGTAALPNAIYGIFIDLAIDNTIGGTVAAAANVISGNRNDGVNIDDGTGNLVEGNEIGTTAAGTAALANAGNGLTLDGGAASNTVGGATTAVANLISGNTGFGIQADGGTTTGNVLANNWVGTGAAGSGSVLNGGGALEITNDASAIAQGQFTGNVVNQGTLGIWNAPGSIAITGNYTQSSVATLDVGLAGTPFAQSDHLAVSGTATLAGTLDVALIDGFSISPLNEFQVVSYGALSGTFATDDYPNGVTLFPGYGPTSLFLYSTPFELVTNTADTGGGSLRQAMTSADALSNNPTWIVFNIPTSDSGYSSGVWKISPLSALPEITAEVVLDGSTQPGYAGTPLVVIDGASAGSGADGLNLNTGSGGSTIHGLVVNDFGGAGISITTSGNLVESSYIGTDVSGTVAAPDQNGIVIEAGATDNTIGGTAVGADNVISGNANAGVALLGTGTSGNVILGNLIGANVTGSTALGNGTDGILLYDGPSGNLIGGTTVSARNIISANADAGVEIQDANDNLVEGDFIGTDVTGTVALGNNVIGKASGVGASGGGVFLNNDASGNIIGGLTATPGTGAGNLISGNTNAGVSMGNAGPNNLVAGNLIGTNVTGSVALGNDNNYGNLSGGFGVEIQYSPENIVGEPGGGNVIAGNGLGVVNGANVSLLDSTGSVVQSNIIGTDITGTIALSTSTYYGVALQFGSYIVGGLTPTPGTGLGNVISGNGVEGIRVANDKPGSTTVIEGNIVGTDPTGKLAVPNINGGIGLVQFSLVTIGGTVAGAGNLISGNNFEEVYLSGSSNNVVAGNLIGTDITGKALLLSPAPFPSDNVVLADGSSDNTIGGTTAAARNIISGSPDDDGVYIGVLQVAGTISSGNVVEGNYIGTDITGSAALGNAVDGVFFTTGAQDNTLGGTTAAARNIISGNSASAVEISGTGATGNVVAGNYIGTDMTGTMAITNGTGVEIDTSASGNTIGGMTSTPGTGAGNVISGNTDNGVVIDGTGLPAETYLYLKADGNPNNSAINPNGVNVGDATLLVGGVTYGTGVTGQAFQFNDTAGERVDVSDPSNFLATTAVTLSAWINLSSLPGATPFVIASRALSATSENYGLYVNSSGELVFEWYSAGAFHTETSSGANLGSRLGNFQQVAAVTDGSTVTFYVNGVAVSSAAMPDPLDDTASGDLEIGGLSQGPNLFNGLIDEISVTLDALPADLIARIYANAGQGTDLGGSGTQDTTIAGNLIGTNFAGTISVPNGGDGVEINNSFNNTIGGVAGAPSNIISGNTASGVEITGTGATGNVVAGDYIGTSLNGLAALANATGVTISSGSSDNTIGGTTSGARDVISGNSGEGVRIQNTTSSGNVVEGDFIGTDMTGDAALGNLDGIVLFASGNTIGGTVAGAGNIIAGNDGTGFIFDGSQILIAGDPGLASDNNLIAGNYIGLDANGQALAGATGGGIVFDELTSGDTTGNTIGGTTAGARNVISGNLGGIGLEGDNGNLVEGNFIGTDPTGTIAIGNLGYGDVDLNQGASNDTIGGTTAGARNIISGDDFPRGGAGVGIDMTTDCVVEGNFIGTDVTGTKALPNYYGIDFGQAINSNDTIGGATATPGTGAGNLIAGNGNGIHFFGESGLVVIEGNAIGQVSLPGGGTSPGNSNDGIDVISSSSSILIGGTSPLDENVISGNASDGIEINASSAVVVEGDLIGTSLNGLAAVPDAEGVVLDSGSTDNTIGGTVSSTSNVISGNLGFGIQVIFGSNDNVVEGNDIGTDVTGDAKLGNSSGIELGGVGNVIGGSVAGAGNIIAGNDGTGPYTGYAAGSQIVIVGLGSPSTATSNNLVEGNYIGLDANGQALPGATGAGILTDVLSPGGVIDNTIGGTTVGARNVISGNLDGLLMAGDSENLVEGNDIGTDPSGTIAIGNGVGDSDVELQGAMDDTIGGTTAAARNIISGATYGVTMGNQHALDNLVEGNYIGTDLTGTHALANSIGVYVVFTAGDNTIGGATSAPGTGAGNLIAGNSNDGVEISSDGGDVVLGNAIGIVALPGGGTSPGNSTGIDVTGSTSIQIGGANAVDTNVTSGNASDGIHIAASSSDLVEGNLIGTNVAGTVAVPNAYGVVVDPSATGNSIGGSTSGAGNVISGNSNAGIEIDGGSSTIIQGNTIGSSPGLGNHIGLYDPATPITLGGTAQGQSNFYGYNSGPGVLLGPAAAVGSSALGERFAGDSEVGILIGTLTTPTSAPAPFTTSSPLFSPVITESSIQSGLLVISGYALPGSVIGFYASASTDVHGNGEGVVFLGSYVEGSADDTNATVGTGTMAGANQFNFTFVVAPSITPGMSVTAISAGTAGSPVVSQFAVDSQTIAGSVGPTISSGGNATVLVGQTFTYQGFLGDNASTTLSGTANYDDGTGNQVLSIQATDVTPASYDEYTPMATGTYSLSHIFIAPGTYDVTFVILDGDSYTASGEVTVTVLATPPTIDPGQVTLAPTNDPTDTASPTIVSVDESMTISGTFTDPNPGAASGGETDTVTVFWGDGSTPTPAAVNQATHTFTATHVYTAPSSIEAGKGLYAVTATLTDSEGLSTTIGGGKLYAEVDDDPPTGLKLGFTSETVAPGGAVSLSGQFQAPQDANDLYDVVVNWGDGTTSTAISLLGGVTSFSGLTHNYQSQPAYRAGTPYTITVSVNDAYEPLDLATATASVSVVAPTASTLAIDLDSNEITEGGTATLAGTLTGAIPGDPHVVVIDWGDGTSTQVPLAGEVADFSGVTHVYPLNSANQPGGVYAITAIGTDTDGAALPGASASTSIKVDDIAPTVSNLVVTTDRDLSATTSLSTIVEGSTVYLTGRYTNPGGVLDSDTITINWGDGTTDQAILQPATLTFLDRHTYADLPAGTTSSAKTIIATATDAEGDTGTASIGLTVTHPAPVVSIQSGGFNSTGQQMLSAPISGGDTAALNYQWTVNNQVVSTTSSYSVSPSLEVVGGNSTSNVVKVTVTEANDPAETSSYSAQLDLLDVPGQTFVVPAPSQGVNAVLVTDLGGNSILAGEALATSGNTIEFSGGLPVIANQVTPSTTPLIFDTPTTGDTYVGNAGDDIFNEHTDGTVAYGMGGNNIFNFQVNCTLTAVADTGQNTLDFASNPYAVTFNMQETEGQTQYVMPGSTDHAVIVNDLGNVGTFSTLDCSNYGDTVTASNGSTIVGGGGMDTVMLSSVSNVTVDASAGGNILENTAGSTVGNVTYLGDTAAASGSDGAVTFSNDASGTITGTLAFEGDSGATTFNNSGTTNAGASISFDGDNAATVFNNTGTQSGTISFDGDSGATTLAGSQGSTGAIAFDGDGAAATFINAVGAVQAGTINFDGDSGGMTFAGQGGTGAISFDGDNAAATFSNSGTQSGTISFDGDGGTATFNNYSGSSQTGAISFDGDSGASSFNNSSGAVQTGAISFDGDSGAATFANNGTAAASITFDGDSGASTFANNGSTATSASVAFDGDGGASTFNNYAGNTTSGSITFDGDSGASTFANNGATVSGAKINFDGDSGATTFNNSGSIAIGATISFDGDSGATTFNNNAGATQSGAVAFDGDSAAGTFTGGQGGSKTINFDGDGAGATFNNYGGSTQSGTVTFDGDSAAGNLGGGHGGSTSISFDGDGGAATFNNYGGSTHTGSVAFDGDGATSTFNNYTGANPTGTISFDGDGGSATFNNNAGATASGTISFDGDGAAATFNNAGTIATSQPIVFTEDSGSSTFNNLSATNQTVAIAFDGDNAAQTFNNAPGATQSGSVSFDGDNGGNTFNNSGTVAKSTSIAFDGDNASQTFNNAPGGTQSGSITFDGDDSLSLYISGSTNDPSPTSDNLLFAGEGNADVFWNQIEVDALTFTPGANSVSATLVNTGSVSAYTIATAGTTVSSIALYNGAIVDGTLEAGTVGGPITFLGGSMAGTLVNDGTINGSVTFVGQAVNGGSSTFLNLGSIQGSISFQGDAGTDALTNDGIVAGAITENAGTGPITLINDGTGATAIDVYGDAAATATTPSVATNRLLNEQSGLSGIQFVGGGGGNLLDNEAAGVGSITLTADGSNNVLSNSGNNFGQITLNGDGSDSTLFNDGSDVGTSADVSSITFDENGGTDALINTGSGLANIVMSGSDLASGLANSGASIGSISVQGGSEVGILLSDGSLGSLAFQSASSGAQSFVNGGVVHSLSFAGASGSDYFENDGTISVLNYVGGDGSDTVVNVGTIEGTPSTGSGESSIQASSAPLTLVNESGGTISGVLISAGPSLDLENFGSIAGGTEIKSGRSSAKFFSYAGSSLTNVSYFASSGGDVVQSEGSLNGLSFYGGDGGATELDLFGPTNENISYYGGTGGDTLGIGASAGNVNNVILYGNLGTDTINSFANNIQNVSLVAGAGAASFYNEGNDGSGLRLIGGAGTAVFYNGGPGSTGGNDTHDVTVTAGSGDTAIDSTGTDFGTLALMGGSGVNYLENDGTGTSSSKIVFIGGTGDNTLDNTGNSVGSIVFADGITTSGGSSVPDNANDTVSNTGNDVGSITATVDSGELALVSSGDNLTSITATAVGGSSSVTNMGSVHMLRLDGGAGNASLIDTPDATAASISSSTINFTDEGGTSTFIDSAPAAQATFVAGPVGGQVVIETGATGPISLTGNKGGDTYTFEGAPQATVSIDQPASTASLSISNELDFSAFSGGAIDLDLENTGPQNQEGLILVLVNGSGINEVVGAPAANTIIGNSQVDVLDTEAIADSSVTSASTPTITAPTQWVYLDFDTYADPIDGEPPQAYSTAERADVLSRLQADYAEFPYIQFTENAADKANVPAADWIVLYFNRTPDQTGQPGGQSSEIDFGSFDPGRYAEIQANGLIGGPGNPPAFSDGQDNFAVLSAKIAAHELAHLLGARHSDAFGPIGYGVHTPPGDAEFSPDLNGPDAAFETFDHLISSPATQGTTRSNDIRPLYFGPREAIKLAFDEQGTVVAATTAAHTTLGTAMPFPLSNLLVPNDITSLSGVEQGMNFEVLAGAVSDTIGLQSGLAAPNWYSFSGQKGDDFTFETESQILPSLANGGSVDTVLGIYDSSGKLLGYYGGSAQNNNQFEGTDSLLDDVILPYTGTFYVEVSSYAAPAGDPMYDPSNPASPLNINNMTSVDNPASPDFDPAAAAAFLATGTGTAVGSYDLFIYRYNQSNAAITSGNTLMSRAPGATLTGTSGDDTLVGTGAGTYIQGGDTVSLTSTVPTTPIDFYDASLGSVLITDTGSMAGSSVTINYGDGTVTTEAASTSISLSHVYASPGTETITVSFKLAAGGTDMLEIPVTIAAVDAPTVTAPVITSGTLAISTPITFGASITNFYPGDTYQAAWTFTNSSAGTSVTIDETVTTASLSETQTFSTAATYTVSLQVTNLTTGLTSTVVTGLSPFTVSAKVTPTLSLSPTSPVYTGLPYAGAVAVLTAPGGASIASAVVSYTYTNATTGQSLGRTPPTDVGSYTVAASYAGSTEYNAVSLLPQPFSITPATLSVTVNSASKPFGTDDSAQLGGTISGILNNDPIVITYSSPGSAATAEVSSTPYPIIAIDSAPSDPIKLTDYILNVVQGNLTVVPDRTSLVLTYSGQIFGQSTTLTATVTAAAPSNATPQGTVTFTDTTTGAILGMVSLSDAGVATLSTAMLANGTNSVTASYAATTDFQVSSSSVQVTDQASIYILNTSTSAALSVSGSAAINVPGMVEVDSSSSSAVQLTGAAKITASAIGIVGGSQVTGSASFSVTPTKVASFTDPLAALPVPSATGLKTYVAVNIGGVTVETIGPGIYPSISVSASAKLTMTAGIYVIDGGGLVVSGAGSLTGSGVMIYNAGSNYNGGTGNSFGGITLSSGSFSLSPPTSGTYAGISIFQSSDNTKPIAISGAVLANLGGGVVFAPAAVMNISGSAQIGTAGTSVSPLIVNELVVSGAAGAYQLAQGATPGDTVSTSNWISDPVLTVAALDDTGAGLDPAEVADLGDAMNYLNGALASFGVNLSWAPAGTTPDVTVHFASTTPEGGEADGVLGFTTAQNAVYIVTGWNFYTGTDPSQIGPDQFDFTTLATHELAHTLGLGESQDPSSVMYEYLAPGTVRRTFTDDNLTVIDTDSDRFMKVATTRPLATANASATNRPVASATAGSPSSDISLMSVSPQTFDSALAGLDEVPDPAASIHSTEYKHLDAALAVVSQESGHVPLEVTQDVAESVVASWALGPNRKRSSFDRAKSV